MTEVKYSVLHLNTKRMEKTPLIIKLKRLKGSILDLIDTHKGY